MKKHILLFLVLISFSMFSQEQVFKGDPDEAFKTARELAFNSQRAQAQDTLRLILTKYPTYNGVRAFLASTYSWDGKYKEAKKEFEIVLNDDPDRLDTWQAAIKNELYAEAPFSALKMVTKALTNFPNNPDILYLKATAFQNSNRREDALKIIEDIIKDHPKHEKAIAYKTSLVNELSNNILGIRASIDVYSEVFDPMQYHLIKYIRRTKYGSIHAKLNLSRRFQSNGAQVEVDLYPRIAEGLYAYLNFGVSNSFLFPDIRYGAELYKSLPKGFEASLGFRALRYDETTNIYTGSVGWYTGNNFWSFRSYVTPGDSGTSMSGTLNFRKYRSNADNYFSTEFGMGFSPELFRFEFQGNENTVVNLQSQKFNLAYFFTTHEDKNAWGIRTEVAHQEISFDPGSYFWIYSLALSWEIRFR